MQNLTFADRSDFLKSLPLNQTICEIGVWRGDFSQEILEVAHPKQLFLVDPWLEGTQPFHVNQTNKDNDCRLAFEKVQWAIDKNIVTIYREKSEDVVGRFNNAFFDWVYVDGDHGYLGVLQDLVHYRNKVKISGYLWGDDYNLDSVSNAVEDFLVRNTQYELLTITGGRPNFILKRRG